MSDHFYDHTGKPLTQQRWSDLRADESYMRLGFDRLDSGFLVNTIWEGIDASMGLTPGPRGIFESVVLDGLGVRESQKYDTEKDAVRGHRRLVLKWRTKLRTEPDGAA